MTKFSRKFFSMTFAAASLAFAGGLLTSNPAAAYTCTFNPAICKAVCGSTTCGSLSAKDRDISRLERAGGSRALAAGGGSGRQAAREKYTCFNPAICRAVCGAESC